MSRTALSASRIPLYLQISEILRQRIDRGIWRQGDLLPTLNELMDEFSVAKVTVRQAVKLLEADHLVLPQRGRGTLVTGAPKGQRRLKVETTLHDLIDMYSGDKPLVSNLREDTESPHGVVEDGTLARRYRHLTRTHSRDDIPYCVISLYIDESVFKLAARRFRTELALPVLFSHPRIEIARARQTMVISKCDPETANLIGIPVGDPVAEVRRILYSPDNRVTYLADVTYRADYIRLDMDLRA